MNETINEIIYYENFRLSSYLKAFSVHFLFFVCIFTSFDTAAGSDREFPLNIMLSLVQIKTFPQLSDGFFFDSRHIRTADIKFVRHLLLRHPLLIKQAVALD